VQEAVFGYKHFGKTEFLGFSHETDQLSTWHVRRHMDTSYGPGRYRSAHRLPPASG